MATQQSYDENIFLDMSMRMRTLEGKYNMLRDRVLLINTNMIAEYKKLLSENQALERDVARLKEDVFHLREGMKHLLEEMEQFARKGDVKVLEKYINLWNPMKFVTEHEVKKIIIAQNNG